MPTANAMSVAMGMPQPLRVSAPASATNTRAGTTMPPSAAMAGRAALRGSLRSPTTSSRLISKPATKKKMVISPSLTQWTSDSSRWTGPTVTSTWWCQKWSTASAAPVLASTRAVTAPTMRAMPERFSRWMIP